MVLTLAGGTYPGQVGVPTVAGGTYPGRGTTPGVDRQTPVKTVPFPILRMRVVKVHVREYLVQVAIFFQKIWIIFVIVSKK